MQGVGHVLSDRLHLKLRLALWRHGVRPFATRVVATKALYWLILGKRLNLENPQDYNEKLQWLKLFWNNPLVTQCADKFAVRQYAAECGCAEVLNELYGVYDRPADIAWEKLPPQFVLKCTHGCGYNVICDDKAKLDRGQTLARLQRWMKTRYGRKYGEYHYDVIRPRILCEKYIQTSAGFLPVDYKIFCCNGRARYVAVATNRAQAVQWHYLDLTWKLLDVTLPEHNKGVPPPKPACWDRMVAAAETLARPFPFVRVDCYDNNGHPLLGEMTFTPVAGLNHGYYSEAGLRYVGGLIHLPAKWRAAVQPAPALFRTFQYPPPPPPPPPPPANISENQISYH